VVAQRTGGLLAGGLDPALQFLGPYGLTEGAQLARRRGRSSLILPMGVERGVVRHNPEELAVVVVFEDQGTTTCFEDR
jgi:hypothetical protein